MLRLLAILVFVGGIGCALCGSAMAQDAAPRDAAAGLSPRVFTEKVAAGLAARLPNYKFTVTGEFDIARKDPDGGEATVRTRNFYDDYKRDAANLDEIVDLMATATTSNCCGGKLDPARIVPVIKDRAWLDDNRPALKVKGRDLDFIFEDFNNELVIVYAEDTEHTMRYLTSNEDIGDRKDLRARAVDNLARLLPKIEKMAMGGFSMMSAGGDYEASLLLFDDMWRDGQIKVHGDIVVAVPAKDMLMVVGSKDRKAIALMRKLATEEVAKSRYRLTDTLFIYRGGRFVKYGRK
jgi:uncharacterized protein YtpQ (UPF0354 family)